MAICYKLDILEALKSKGLSTYKLRKEKLLSEGVIQSLRSQKMISLENVGQLCFLLDCQPGTYWNMSGMKQSRKTSKITLTAKS